MTVGSIRAPILLSVLLGGCASRVPRPLSPAPEPEAGNGVPEFEARTEVDPETGAVVREWTEYRTEKGFLQRHGKEIRRWPDGSLRAERVFAFGEPVGHSREWYEDGTPRLDVTFAGPEVDASMLFWHPNGQLSAEGVGRDSVRTGPWTFYYENGQKSKQGEYVDGQRAGQWTLWYPNGGLEARGILEGNERVGNWQLWPEEPPTFEAEGDQ